MDISTHAPHYPIIEGEIWELPALHQVLVAFDECRLARQQSLILGGEEQQRAHQNLKKAELELDKAKAAFVEALNALNKSTNKSTQDEKSSANPMLVDLEAVWESTLFLPTAPPTP